MRASIKLATAIAISAGCAAVTIHGLQAQAKPPVYVVNEVEVIDAAAMKTYADAQSGLIKKHGGRYIIQAGKILATLSGAAPAGRFTIYTFENADKMQAWRDDPAQKDVLGTRDKAAKFRSFVVEGLPQ
jgi:uncharacterized protein (DUF1330 family)